MFWKSDKYKRTIKYYSNKISKPKIIMRSLQKADIIKTHGDNSKLKKSIGNFSFTKFEIALDNTLNWYQKNKIEKDCLKFTLI